MLYKHIEIVKSLFERAGGKCIKEDVNRIKCMFTEEKPIVITLRYGTFGLQINNLKEEIYGYANISIESKKEANIAFAYFYYEGRMFRVESKVKTIIVEVKPEETWIHIVLNPPE